MNVNNTVYDTLDYNDQMLAIGVMPTAPYHLQNNDPLDIKYSVEYHIKNYSEAFILRDLRRDVQRQMLIERIIGAYKGCGLGPLYVRGRKPAFCPR